jgi:protein involved in polysaccharide export with SLBB domain
MAQESRQTNGLKKCMRRMIAPALAALFCVAALNGCAAVTNPVADGLPVRYVPEEFLAKPKDPAQTIPLDLLGQQASQTYRLAPEDILGVWIEGVLPPASGDGKAAISLPLQTPPNFQIRDQRRLPPSMGFPITVRDDGAIRLPLIDPIKVQGLSVGETEDAIRAAYAKKKILPPGREQVIVTLMYPRQTHVVVLRQESGNITIGPAGGLAGGKRGTGHVLDLPAYENDVLHAISQTGGMPGLDAYNDIFIFRNSFGNDQGRAKILEKLRAMPPGENPAHVVGADVTAVRIPLRQRPGEPMPFGPQDVLLRNGDVVFVEARDPDLFYTGGLLPAGEQILPRDYDLDVIKAISRVQGPLINGAFGTNQLAGNLIAPGLGSPSPVLLTVLRRTPSGGQIPIRVDLDRALRDPRERILVQAGDVLILQEKPSEAVARYLTQTVFNFNIVWQAIRGNGVTGVIDVAAPDRLGSRAITVTSP